MRLVGIIRPTNTEEIDVPLEPGQHSEALEALRAKVPEGYQLVSTRRQD